MRYSLVIHRDVPEYVAACYDRTGDGLRTTLDPNDACSWLLYESAARVAKHLIQSNAFDVSIRPVSF